VTKEEFMQVQIFHIIRNFKKILKKNKKPKNNGKELTWKNSKTLLYPLNQILDPIKSIKENKEKLTIKWNLKIQNK
jgi:hypothetical protein